jgi:hypothetical protein
MAALRVIVILTLTGAVAAGCGSHAAESGSDSHSQPAVPPGAIAVVGDRPVSRAALDAELARSRRAYAAQGKAFPARRTAAYRRLRAIAIRLVTERAQMELWAEARGIRITAADVDRRLRQVRRAGGLLDDERWHEALRREGLSEADVRANVRALVVAAALRPPPKDVTKRPRIVYATGYAPSNDG